MHIDVDLIINVTLFTLIIPLNDLKYITYILYNLRRTSILLICTEN